MKSDTTVAHDVTKHESLLARFAQSSANWTGSTAAFVAAVLLILVWAVSRPLFDSFDTWQLVINTATTIITFLMVFLIQRAQNKDARAIHLKLNELIAAVRGASNRLINAEDLTETELHALRERYAKLGQLFGHGRVPTGSHTVEEAVEEAMDEAKEQHAAAH
jgi:low affinity Fe/Cu permease